MADKPPIPEQERRLPQERSAEAAELPNEPEALAEHLQRGAEQATYEHITLPAKARLSAIESLDGDPSHAEAIAANYAARAERLTADLQEPLNHLRHSDITPESANNLIQYETTAPEPNPPAKAADLDIAMPAAASAEQFKPTELEVEQGRFNAWLVKLVDALRDGTLPNSFRNFIDAKPNAEQYKNAADKLQIIYKAYLADPRIPTDKVQSFTVQVQELAYNSTQTLLAPRPPETKKPLSEGAAGDDELDDATVKSVQVEENKGPEAAQDIFAERNAASQAYVKKLLSPDFSATNHSMDPIVTLARTLLQQHPETVARFDNAGNLVLGQPEADSSGLSHRLLTLETDTHQEILEWLHRSLPQETLTLRDNRYTITVVDDPKLKSEYLEEVA